MGTRVSITFQASCFGVEQQSTLVTYAHLNRFWKRFPWIGFGALIMVLVALVASVIVLVTSNHVSQSKWPKDAAPNLLLNVMSQIENICFIMAIGKSTAATYVNLSRLTFCR
jgi:hypothetical protein